MFFKRLDETTVRCMVSKEDLEQYDISFEDFFKDAHKSRSFIQSIVERAKEETDFETHSNSLSVQVMVIPPDSIAITLSEDNGFPDMSRIANDIKDLAGDIEEFGLDNRLEGLTDKKKGEFEKFLKSVENLFGEDVLERAIAKSEEKSSDGKKKKRKKSQNENENNIRIFKFDKFNDVEMFADYIYSGKSIRSAVYRDKNGSACYLIVEKGRLGINTFKNICERTSDFASSERFSVGRYVYIKEHCDCIIKEKAIERLAKM